MSYDLLFLADDPPGSEQFEKHFAERANYEVEDGQARYENEDTGVSFAFERSEGPPEDPEDDVYDRAWAGFQINFLRPRFFAQEAVRELEAFVERFGDRVYDAQVGGIGDGPFDGDAFVRSWEGGNRFAATAIAGEGDLDVTLRPAEDLQRIWTWNIARQERQAALGEEIFVPRIAFYETPGGVVSASVWTDAIPVVLPRTEAVVVYRMDLAPRKLLRRTPGAAVVPWREIEPLLAGRRHEDDPLPHHFLEYTDPPAEISRWVRKLPEVEIEYVSMDEVLDADLLEPLPAD